MTRSIRALLTACTAMGALTSAALTSGALTSVAVAGPFALSEQRMDLITAAGVTGQPATLGDALAYLESRGVTTSDIIIVAEETIEESGPNLNERVQLIGVTPTGNVIFAEATATATGTDASVRVTAVVGLVPDDDPVDVVPTDAPVDTVGIADTPTVVDATPTVVDATPTGQRQAYVRPIRTRPEVIRPTR